MSTSEMAMILGTLALVCWMGSGLSAVLATDEEIRHGMTSRAANAISTALAGAGVFCALAMFLVLVIAFS